MGQNIAGSDIFNMTYELNLIRAILALVIVSDDVPLEPPMVTPSEPVLELPNKPHCVAREVYGFVEVVRVVGDDNSSKGGVGAIFGIL